MTAQLKLLALVNWHEEGKWSFLLFLKKKVRSVDVLQPVAFKNRVFLKLNRLSNYLSEFYGPLMAVFRKKQHDVVIAWQMRIGITYGILKRLFHAGRPPIHIIQDFHIDLTQTRWPYRAQIGLLKMAIPGIDYFCCTSTEEEEIYSRMFNIPRDRIVFLPLVETSRYFTEPARPIKDCIFSYGRSDRDYDTLVRAVTPLDIQTYILSSKYRPQVPVPDHVSIIREYISGEEMVQWIASSRIVVLPLKDYRISAGQISMLEVMALARPLIITENMATREYAAHRETALFYPAGNAGELTEQIRYLWDHGEEAERIGRQARQAASKLNDKRERIFSNLLERCATDILKGERR